MNDNLQSRLHNFKFESALQYLDGEPIEVKDLVDVLAKMFGNVGYIPGDFGIILVHALENIGVEFDDDGETYEDDALPLDRTVIVQVVEKAPEPEKWACPHREEYFGLCQIGGDRTKNGYGCNNPNGSCCIDCDIYKTKCQGECKKLPK